MKNDILKELRDVDRVGLLIRQIEDNVEALKQVVARAADEIEFLRQKGRKK